MNEKQIAVSSLMLAVFGLIVIFVFTQHMRPKEARISDLDLYENSYVEISGYVSRVRHNRGNVFITLCKEECTTVALFENVAKQIKSPNPYLIEKGDRLVVRGEVTTYQGQSEVIVLRTEDIERG